MFITISCFTQTATPVEQNVDEMVNGTWGERVTLQCLYRPGNYMSAYTIEWLMVGVATKEVKLMEPFSLNPIDFSLSVELNPFSMGIYQCRVTINSDSPDYNHDIFPGLNVNLSISGMLMIYSSIFLIQKI